MMNSSMFTLSNEFRHISEYVDELRFENRTAIVKFVSVWIILEECSKNFI